MCAATAFLLTTPPAITSEDDFLACIDRHFPRRHGHVALGRGDDCAILALEREQVLCLSTDLFLEDIHFRRRYCTPGEIGHKALAVNISDIAAMGGRPLGFSLGLMVPSGLPPSFWDECFAGMAALAQAHDIVLTGGDLSRAPMLGFSVSIWGQPAASDVPANRPFLQRGPVQPGDVLYVAGQTTEEGALSLGLARQGLHWLEQDGRQALAAWPACAAAHLTPTPQVACGLTMAARPAVRGCMDISDGVAKDLPRLLAFGQRQEALPGADLHLRPGVLHPELLAACAQRDLDPVREALLGGEDYLLLLAMRPQAGEADEVKAPEAFSSQLLAIGEVTAQPGIRLHGEGLSGMGFDHFSAS